MNYVKDIDRGWSRLRSLFRRQVAGPHVKVGVQGPSAMAAHADSQMTMVEVGAIHEFGRGKIPKRSFIRQTFDIHRGEYAKAMQNAAARVITGSITTKIALEAIGQRAQSDMQTRIEENSPAFKPLKESTIAARKRRFGVRTDKPLSATGQLKGSITYATENV